MEEAMNRFMVKEHKRLISEGEFHVIASNLLLDELDGLTSRKAWKACNKMVRFHEKQAERYSKQAAKVRKMM